MRCERSLRRGEPTAAPSDSGNEALPLLEAAPAELARRAGLIPEPETVLPIQLPSAPGATPGEGEAMLDRAFVGHDLAGVVRAARTRRDPHPLDAEIGVLVKELGQDALDLHPWRMTLELDSFRGA